MTVLPTPEPGRAAAEAFVVDHLGHLVRDDVRGSERFRGGQVAADIAVQGYDVAGYAGRRNEVAPESRRGASALSPYVRYGLVTLGELWRHVADGPPKDRSKFRDELLWQEYARHWYARLGTTTRQGVRAELDSPAATDSVAGVDGWDRRMRCLDETVGELETDGWIVNQTRMWLSSHWAVRSGARWRDGEDEFFAHLLDGSRAANRLGWQWTVGVGSNKPYGFSRWQVQKRAPSFCADCELRHACPIEDWPDDPPLVSIERPAAVGGDPDPERTGGPLMPEIRGTAEVVWLTAESLGDADPALAADPELPAVFVFDEPLLAGLRLSSKRLVFLVETLADLHTRRPVELRLGRVPEELAGRRTAVTHAPVPGFARIAAEVDVAELFPTPWLVRPHGGSIASFSAWRKKIGRIAA